MNVIDWFVGGFLTEFSNEFMNVGCLMYVQRVGVNVWIYLCVRVDDGMDVLKRVLMMGVWR